MCKNVGRSRDLISSHLHHYIHVYSVYTKITSFSSCLLIDPHASLSETTVKMKPSSFIFWAEPDGPPRSEKDQFFAFFQNVMSRVHGERPEKLFSWIDSPLPRGAKSRRNPKTNEKCCIRTEPDESQSANAFLILVFLCEYEKSALFLLISLLPGGFCPNDTFLFVHQSACFMNVLQWTVFVSLLEKKKEKRNCPRILKSTQTPSPTEFVCNQLDMALTSMYTKVLKWDDTECSTKCWNMSQYSPPSVIIHFVCIIYHPVQSFSVFSCEKSGEAPFASDGILHGLRCNVRFWITLLMSKHYIKVNSLKSIALMV